MTENEILDVLHGVQHPELQSDIVSLGMSTVSVSTRKASASRSSSPGRATRSLKRSASAARKPSPPLSAIRGKNIGVRQGGPT